MGLKKKYVIFNSSEEKPNIGLMIWDCNKYLFRDITSEALVDLSQVANPCGISRKTANLVIL